jgi:hypothetical protein
MGQEMLATWRRKPSAEPRRIQRDRLFLSRRQLNLDGGEYLAIALFVLAAVAGIYVVFFVG